MRYPVGLKAEAKLAEALHWSLVLAGSGHMKWYDPQGRLKLTTSMTPSGRRGVLNAKADLKRCGVGA
jgi:hypothetical protein